MKRNKNDMADAEAICEAVNRLTMRFVAIKTPDQQSVLVLHGTRQLFIRQRTTLINALRAHLAELGIVAGIGSNGLERLLKVIEDRRDERAPAETRECFLALSKRSRRRRRSWSLRTSGTSEIGVIPAPATGSAARACGAPSRPCS